MAGYWDACLRGTAMTLQAVLKGIMRLVLQSYRAGWKELVHWSWAAAMPALLRRIACSGAGMQLPAEAPS